MALPSYQDYAAQMGAQYGLPNGLLPWVIKTESDFIPDARNPTPGSTATGIAQFTNATAKDRGVNQLDPYDSIRGAASYLSDLYTKTGSWLGATNAYGTTKDNVKKQQEALSIINNDPQQSVKDHIMSQLDASIKNGFVNVTDPQAMAKAKVDAQNSPSLADRFSSAIGTILLFALGGALLVLALLNTDAGKQTLNIVTSKIKA